MVKIDEQWEKLNPFFEIKTNTIVPVKDCRLPAILSVKSLGTQVGVTSVVQCAY